MARMPQFELQIEGLSHDGRGVGFMPGAGRGKAVFVAGALPGQRALCVLLKEKTGWAEARCDKVLAPASAQRPPVCPHHGECGGCPLQLMPLDSQLYWKERLALEAMKRIGGFRDIEEVWRKPLFTERIGRNKVEFAFGAPAGLGFRRSASHATVVIKNCPAAGAAAVAIKDAWLEAIKRPGLPASEKDFWRFLVIRQGEGGFWVTCLTGKSGCYERKVLLGAARELLKIFPSIRAFIHEERLKKDRLARGENRVFCVGPDGGLAPEAATMTHILSGWEFAADASSFFQVNGCASGLLAGLIMDLDKEFGRAGGSMLDLYCGVGAPGQFLAQGHRRLLGLELDGRSIGYARKNALAHGCGNCVYAQADLEREMPHAAARGEWSTVLLDPPRGGLSEKVRSHIKKLLPDKVIYVSCNVSTMARDMKDLAACYDLACLTGVDMFPNTPHLECVGIMQKKQAGAQ